MIWQKTSLLCVFLLLSLFWAPGHLPAEETGESFETIWQGLKLNYRMLRREVANLQFDLQKARDELQDLHVLNLRQLHELKRLMRLSRALELDLIKSREASEELMISLGAANASLSEATNSARKAARRNRWLAIGVGAGGLVLGATVGLIVGLTAEAVH